MSGAPSTRYPCPGKPPAEIQLFSSVTLSTRARMEKGRPVSSVAYRAPMSNLRPRVEFKRVVGVGELRRGIHRARLQGDPLNRQVPLDIDVRLHLRRADRLIALLEADAALGVLRFEPGHSANHAHVLERLAIDASLDAAVPYFAVDAVDEVQEGRGGIFRERANGFFDVEEAQRAAERVGLEFDADFDLLGGDRILDFSCVRDRQEVRRRSRERRRVTGDKALDVIARRSTVNPSGGTRCRRPALPRSRQSPKASRRCCSRSCRS